MERGELYQDNGYFGPLDYNSQHGVSAITLCKAERKNSDRATSMKENRFLLSLKLFVCCVGKLPRLEV